MAHRKLFLATIENGVSETSMALSRLPVEVHPVPVSRIEPCIDAAEVEHIRARLNDFDWIMFTSANAADVFFRCVGPSPDTLSPRMACIGPNTADHVRSLGYTVEYVAPTHTGDSFAQTFAQTYGQTSGNILLPRPEKMASSIIEHLSRKGFAITPLVMYRTTPLPIEEMPAIAFEPSDIFVFLSPSGIRHFRRRYAVPDDAAVFVIGPTTAAAAADQGFSRIYKASESSRDGLLDVLREFLDNDPQP